MEGILAHELFHFAFASYRKLSPQYSSVDSTDVGSLLERIHNEGIAHYVDKRQRLLTEYESDPQLKVYEQNNFEALNIAFTKLQRDSLTESETKTLLRKASIGRYWTKYGSISGMFMAYHIEQELGRTVLIECIRRGPYYFLKQFNDIQHNKPSLPALGSEWQKYLQHSTPD